MRGRTKELITSIKVYIFTWILILGLIFGLVWHRTTFDQSLETIAELLSQRDFWITLHVLYILVYLLFLLFRYFIRVYRKQGFKTMGIQASLRVLIPAFIVLAVFKTIIYTNGNEDFDYQWDHSIENTTGKVIDRYLADGKHRGMSVFGWSDDNEKEIEILVQNNIEWVAVIPFLYQKNENTTKMSTPETIAQWSQRDSLFIKTITQLHAKGMHVQLKPHLWIREGWRSNIKYQSNKDWDSWFDTYRKNMLHYAHMAEATHVELLCIGTELRSSLQQQPDQWRSLVQEIKTIYNGKLTYAANWDGEYELIDFWNELDYIGLQAYFPITQKANPDLEAIKSGWDSHITKLQTLSNTYNKPILFTEVGYKSEASATIKPWEWGSFFSILYRKKSNRTQHLAYQALFDKLWHQEWFAGIYVWEWNTRSTPNGAENSLNFSPRFKPAQNTIAKGFGID